MKRPKSLAIRYTHLGSRWEQALQHLAHHEWDDPLERVSVAGPRRLVKGMLHASSPSWIRLQERAGARWGA